MEPFTISLGDLSLIADNAQGFEEGVFAGYAKGYREGHQAGYEQASAAAHHRDYSQGQTYSAAKPLSINDADVQAELKPPCASSAASYYRRGRIG